MEVSYDQNSLHSSIYYDVHSYITFIVLYLSFRYQYPWWREKEIVSEERRSQGLCPLTPEEAALILQALGFGKDTQIYIAAGEIYGSERRLAVLRAAFPNIVSVLIVCILPYCPVILQLVILSSFNGSWLLPSVWLLFWLGPQL